MKLGMLFVCLSFLATAAQAEERRILVSSYAEKSVDPNMVSLNVEVWSKASTAKQAQSANASEFAKVKKTLDSFKIKKEDIQTESYSLNPEYTYDQKAQQNRMVGFRALQVLRVTLRKTEDLGGFLDTVVSENKGSSGVNINSIAWDTDKRAALELSALGDAVRSGRAKAEELAKAAGVKIKNVAVLSHGVADRSPVQESGFRMEKAQMAADSSATEVAPGQIKVRVDVNAQYDIQ